MTNEQILSSYKIGDNGCWIWQGYKDPKGYGGLYYDGKTTRAHRVFYTLFKEEIPVNLQIDHLCRNKACVNPNHLEAVTIQENNSRSMSVSAINARKTHCIHGHEFNDKNTRAIVRTTDHRKERICRTCARIRDSRRDRKDRWAKLRREAKILSS